MQLNYEEQEKLKQELFIEVIRLAPAGSELIVTTDSWQGIPDLLGERLIARKGEWAVPLTMESRAFLIQQALYDNLQTKFAHFYIIEDGKVILSSFDGMCSIVLEDAFPESQQLKLHYAALEVM